MKKTFLRYTILLHLPIPAPEEVFDSSFLSQTFCLCFALLLLLSHCGVAHRILKILQERVKKHL